MLVLEEEIFLRDCTIVTLCNLFTKLCADFLRCAPADAPRTFAQLFEMLRSELEQLQRDTPQIVTRDQQAHIVRMIKEAIDEAQEEVAKELRRIH
jgi:hypothetical protein